jgi:hypothetical protein
LESGEASPLYLENESAPTWVAKFPELLFLWDHAHLAYLERRKFDRAHAAFLERRAQERARRSA